MRSDLIDRDQNGAFKLRPPSLSGAVGAGTAPGEGVVCAPKPLIRPALPGTFSHRTRL